MNKVIQLKKPIDKVFAVKEKLKELLYWSNRLGSDEKDEIEQCIEILNT